MQKKEKKNNLRSKWSKTFNESNTIFNISIYSYKNIISIIKCYKTQISRFKTKAEPSTTNAPANVGSEDRDQSKIK